MQTHDSIFFYEKGVTNIFNKQRSNYSEKYLANFSQADEEGRRYWQWSATERRYSEDRKGLAVSDIWDDDAKNYSNDDGFDFDTWGIRF